MAQSPDQALNIARVAIPSSLTVMSENKISALNDGFVPENSFDRSHGLYALHRDWPSEAAKSWVQYDWSEPVNVNKVEVYWAVDRPRPGRIAGQRSWRRIARAAELPHSLLERVRLRSGESARRVWASLRTRSTPRPSNR